MRSFDKNKSPFKSKLKGVAMLEYIVGLSALLIALIVFRGPNGLTAVEFLEQALKNDYTAYSKSIASPR